MLNYAISCSGQVSINPISLLQYLFDLIVSTLCAFSEIEPGNNSCPHCNLQSDIKTPVVGTVVSDLDTLSLPQAQHLASVGTIYRGPGHLLQNIRWQ